MNKSLLPLRVALRQSTELELLIKALEKTADGEEKLAKSGSPLTSMSEDHTYGEIAKVRREIATRLRGILALSDVGRTGGTRK